MEDAELKTINERIGVAEQEGDTGFLCGVLSDTLIFKRANGSVVSKEEFLAGVPNNMFERKSSAIEVVFEDNHLAVVSLIVEAKGNKIRNLRVFERAENGWQCVIWHNAKIG
jgi:hypothetical protein